MSLKAILGKMQDCLNSNLNIVCVCVCVSGCVCLCWGVSLKKTFFFLCKKIIELLFYTLTFFFFYSLAHSVITVRKKPPPKQRCQKWMGVQWPESHPHPHFNIDLCWPTSPSPSSWNTGGIDMRDRSKIAGAKSLTAQTRYACSLEREV